MRRIRLVLATLAAAILVTSLAACSTTPSVEVPDGAVIIDVRTPEEYAEGHLEGAINVNLQSGAFEQEIAEQPLGGSYIVYCRTGNRSAQAVAIMNELGFTDVTDAGGVSDASAATGIPIVTD